VSGGYITGGGALKNSANTAGMIKGALDELTSFSMDVKWNNRRTNAQGKVNNIIVWSYYKPNGTLDNVLHQYQVNSTAIATFTVGQNQCPECATFTSKATLAEILEGSVVSLEGNANLQVTMKDLGSGCSDMIGITLYRKAGGVWFSTYWNGTNTIEQVLGAYGNTSCGNIYVSTAQQQSSNNLTKGSLGLENVEETPGNSGFTVHAFPNPAERYFNLMVNGKSDEEVQITVFDGRGQVVYQARGAANKPYRFGENWTGGMYYVQVRQGKEVRTIKLVKQ
ncbi:MAG: T9SS type A sorting domain-containing protein, partial [Chitinophagaceae bacterium]